MDINEFKNKAKESLNGKYKDAVILLLIIFAISLVASAILGIISGVLNLNENIVNILSNITSTIITSFLAFGELNFYLKISRNEEVTYKELFSKTNMFLKYIILYIIIYVLTCIGFLLFIVPGFIVILMFSQVYYIVLENPEIKITDALKQSKEMMDGHKMEYLSLIFSFLGWFILGIFTLGLLYFWLMPYVAVTQANYYNWLKTQQKKEAIAES